MEAKYIIPKPILTEEQKAEFDRKYDLTSDAQKTYGQVVLGIMEKMGIDAEEAENLTGLNIRLFNNLHKPGGSIKKRFVVSIAMGFGLDVHLTEYILESCSMKFNTNDRLDKAYITLIEEHKGKSIFECNAILRDWGIDGKDMLGELDRGANSIKK